MGQIVSESTDRLVNLFRIRQRRFAFHAVRFQVKEQVFEFFVSHRDNSTRQLYLRVVHSCEPLKNGRGNRTRILFPPWLRRGESGSLPWSPRDIEVEAHQARPERGAEKRKSGIADVKVEAVVAASTKGC